MEGVLDYRLFHNRVSQSSFPPQLQTDMNYTGVALGGTLTDIICRVD